MGRKLLVLLLCGLSALYLTNCTSKGTPEDGDSAVEESSLEEMSADASPEGGQNPTVAETPPSDGTITDAPVAEITAPETSPASEAPPSLTNDTSMSSNSLPTPPSSSASSGDSLSTSSNDLGSQSMAQPSSEFTPLPETKSEVKSEPKASAPPYQKVASTPFEKDGKMMNTVFLARKHDTWAKVAKKIFGDKSKSKTLKKWNSSLAQRKLKVGDKVYYNSPNRPDDNSKILTYFEDKGDIPQTYVAKDGDKLKAVAKELLGSTDYWKELWATNPVESKGNLSAGTELRYWKGSDSHEEAAPPAMAKTEANSNMAMNEPPPPPPPVMNEPPPPPPPPAAMNEPPPPPQPVAEAPPPPPPPPPPEMNNNVPPPPPPPPPPPHETAQAPAAEEEEHEGSGGMGMPSGDMIPLLAGGVGVLVLLVILLVIKKRKSAAMDDQAFDEKTHVG